MKKIIVLILCTALLGDIPVYAEHILYQSAQKQESINNSQITSPNISKEVRAETLKVIQSINCNNVTDNNICNGIEIVKTQLPLKSYLKKDYSAYSYIITNNQENPVEIIEVNGFKDPLKEISGIKSYRVNERFPGALVYPIVGTLLFPLFLGFTKDDPDATGWENFKHTINFIYFTPIISTVFAPYYWIADPKNDKKAITESLIFNNKFEKIMLNQNDKTHLTVLLYKKKYNNPYIDKLSLQIKETKAGKIYKIEK